MEHQVVHITHRLFTTCSCHLFAKARRPSEPCALKISDEGLLPGLDQSFCLGLASVHDEIAAFARFADIVGPQGKAYAFGAAGAAREAQVAPPSAVVVPNVVIGSVFAVRQGNDLFLHGLNFREIFPDTEEYSS